MNQLDVIVSYIEKINNIKLYHYQKLILKWMLEGKKFYYPRQVGRRFLLNGYTNYVKEEKRYDYK